MIVMHKQLISKPSANRTKEKQFKKHRHKGNSNLLQLPYIASSREKAEFEEEEFDNIQTPPEQPQINSNESNSKEVIELKTEVKVEAEIKVEKDSVPIRDIDEDIKLLSLLRREYEKEQETTVIQIGNLSSEYNRKVYEIKRRAKENKLFFEQIRDIHNEAKIKEKLNKIYQIKYFQLNQSILAYEETIKLHTIEQTQLSKLLEETKKEKEFIENIYQQLNDNREKEIIPSITNELKTINDQANVLNEVIQQLHKISAIHKNCERNNKNLLNTINLLTKQFEADKAQSRYRYNNNNNYIKIERKEVFTKNNDNSFSNNNNFSFITSRKEDNANAKVVNLFKERLNSPKETKMPYYLSSIKKNGLYSERLIRKKGINKSLSHIDSNPIKRNALFDTEEKVVLIKWIPSHKINDYENRFNNIKEEKKVIEEKILIKSASQKSEIKLNKNKNEENNKLLQEQKEEISQLQTEYCSIKKKVFYVKNKIKDTKSSIQKTTKDILQKESDYNILMNHYNTIVAKLNLTKKNDKE